MKVFKEPILMQLSPFRTGRREELEMTQGRRYTAEQIADRLRQIELSLARGSSAPEACNEAGITEQTYYRWRGQFGHLSVDQIRRMRDLEQENRKLRRLVAGLTLDLTSERQAP
jgi:putative transposase